MRPKGWTEEHSHAAYFKLRDEAKAHVAGKPHSGEDFDEYIRVGWAKICGVETPKPVQKTPPREPPPPQLVEVTGPQVRASGSERKRTMGDL